jgi:MFS transporter, ACS family, tartrate transporter
MNFASAGSTLADVVEISHRTRRHIAARLLPFLFLLYIVNYLDRTSVAYAAVAMSRELGFSDRVYGLGTGIFFISYLALQIPGALLVERWSARRVICVAMVAWGSLTALTGLIHTAGELYLARFLLGVAEGCFFPGVIVYLSHWFIREDRAKATSNFMGAIPLSFVVGSPIAGWILGRGWLGFAGWRWLFLVEGTPAIVLGAVTFCFLTDWPREAAWLTPERRQWIEQMLQAEKPAGSEKVSMGQALKSRAVLLLASLTLFQYAVIYTFAFWFPTMLKRQSGLSDARLGVLGAVPYAVAFVAMQVNAWHSDKAGERRWHSIIPLLIAAAGSTGLILPTHSLALSMVWFSMVATVLAYLPTYWAMPTEILSQSAAAVAVGLINAVGNIAGFAGPYLFGYLNTRTGSFSCGLALMAICGAAGGLLILYVPRRDPRLSN